MSKTVSYLKVCQRQWAILKFVKNSYLNTHAYLSCTHLDDHTAQTPDICRSAMALWGVPSNDLGGHICCTDQSKHWPCENIVTCAHSKHWQVLHNPLFREVHLLYLVLRNNYLHNHWKVVMWTRDIVKLWTVCKPCFFLELKTTITNTQ